MAAAVSQSSQALVWSEGDMQEYGQFCDDFLLAITEGSVEKAVNLLHHNMRFKGS